MFDGKEEMRSEFEKLHEIKRQIHKFIFDSDLNCYRNKVKSADIHLVTWVNGAWYAYQEQQKKIDATIGEISRALNCCESIETECVLVEIKELLK